MAAINLASLTKDEITEFLNSFDTILTDCDGVLWIQKTPLPLATEVINTFWEHGKTVFYITNNSTRTRQQFVEEFKALNFRASIDNILCTSNLTASYLKDLNFSGKAYVIGSEAIASELEEVGISHCGVGPDPYQGPSGAKNVQKDNLNSNSYISYKKDPSIGAVIVGFDAHFSFPKMLKAATYLNDKNVHFIGTNTDESFPVSSEVVIPGTGSFVRCIECCAEREAVIMGKPGKYIAQVVNKRYKIDPQRTLMIGDRCNTDILFGTRCGYKTLLVLTGVTNMDHVSKLKQSDRPEDKELVPDYFISKLGDLLPYLQKYQKT